MSVSKTFAMKFDVFESARDAALLCSTEGRHRETLLQTSIRRLEDASPQRAGLKNGTNHWQRTGRTSCCAPGLWRDGIAFGHGRRPDQDRRHL